VRRLLWRLADKVLGPNPYQELKAPPIPPPPNTSGMPQGQGADIMRWGLENAPTLFAQAREADRRMRNMREGEEK